MNSQIFAITMLMFAGFAAIAHSEKRSFTEETGRILDGELVSVAGDMVTIRRTSDGKVVTMKAAMFSQADQVYFAIQGGGAPAESAKVAQVKDKAAAPVAGSGTTSRTPPMRIDVRVFPVRKQTSQKDIIDDSTQRISYRVEIRNEERERALTGAKVALLAFAQDLNDRLESIVIARDDFDVSIEPLTSKTLVTKEVKLVFDERGAKYGYKYTGSHVLVLKDSDGKIINVTPGNAAAAKFPEEVLKLKVKDVIDKNFKFIKTGYLRS